MAMTIIVVVYFLILVYEVLHPLSDIFDTDKQTNFDLAQFYNGVLTLSPFLLIQIFLIISFLKPRGIALTNQCLIDNQYFFGVLQIEWSAVEDISLLNTNNNNVLYISLRKGYVDKQGWFRRQYAKLKGRQAESIRYQVSLRNIKADPSIILKDILEAKRKAQLG